MQEKSALEREVENIYKIYILLPTSHLSENFINIAYICFYNYTIKAAFIW